MRNKYPKCENGPYKYIIGFSNGVSKLGEVLFCITLEITRITEIVGSIGTRSGIIFRKVGRLHRFILCLNHIMFP